MFCKHDWKVLSDVTMESSLEAAYRCIKAANVIPLVHTALRDANATQVTICSCNKCGKIKKFKTQVGN